MRALDFNRRLWNTGLGRSPTRLPRVTAPEATIEQTGEGAVVASPGWFVLNMSDCAWTRDEMGGEWSTYGEPEGEFQQYGIGIHVLHVSLIHI